MAMVCTLCNTSHQQRLQCPNCGGRLVFRPAGRSLLPGASRSWMQTFLGRVVIGLLLAQGLFLGLLQLTTGILLARLGDQGMQQLFRTTEGLILLESLRLVPLCLGGLLAGAGQRQAFFLGFVIGLCNSALAMFSQAVLTNQVSSLSWYGQPLSQALSASIGAWLGSTIWQPLNLVTAPGAVLRSPRHAALVRNQRPLLFGRVSRFRVCLGVLLTVAGCLWAEFLFQTVLHASRGLLDTASYTQDRIFAWEIRALSALFGGALAGATTSNGFKQGLYVGIGSSCLLLLIPQSHVTLFIASLTGVSTFFLCTAGGWFGSQLFPPLVPKPSTRTAGVP